MGAMRELKPVDVTSTPDVLRLAEEVARSGLPVVLKANSEDLAVMTPASKPKRRSGRAKPVTREDSLFTLIGIGRSKTDGGVSEQKHEALARAYQPSISSSRRFRNE